MTEVKELQDLKILDPIERTLSGMVTDVRLSQFENALLPMEISPEPKVTEVI